MFTKHKKTDFQYLMQRGYSIENVVAFFLKDSGISISDIAVKAHVGRAMALMVLTGQRTSDRVKDAFVSALGFDPWAV